MTCGAVHPTEPTITCREDEGDHAEHFGGYGEEAQSWPNADHVPPPPEEGLTGHALAKSHLTDMARRLRQAQ
jgi:hypothetical protein